MVCSPKLHRKTDRNINVVVTRLTTLQGGNYSPSLLSLAYYSASLNYTNIYYINVKRIFLNTLLLVSRSRNVR